MPHFLVNVGDGGVWDVARAAADVERIVQAQRRIWGFLPYDRYLFLNLITESGGDIEPKDSAVLMTSRWQMRDPSRYIAWLTRYSGERGFTVQEFRATVAEAAKTNLGGWLEAALETLDELDYTEALDWYGLDLSDQDGSDHREDDSVTPAWLGLVTRAVDGRLVVAEVRRDTPAYAAGFSVGDEILAVDRVRVGADEWDRRLRLYRAGEDVAVLVTRRGRLTDLDVTFGADPELSWELTLRSDPTEAQTDQLDLWLGSPDD